MKRKFFLLFVFTTVAVPCLACYPTPGLKPKEYRIFRLCGDNMRGDYRVNDVAARVAANCEEWARITSEEIPTEDIRQVVYKWSVERVEELRNAEDAPDNAFAAWIVNRGDEETIDFLVLAKTSEAIRERQTTLWYYHVDGDQESMELGELIDKAREYNSERLADRYALQILRALFASRRYADCAKAWEELKGLFCPNVLRDMAVDYVVGSYKHLGWDDKIMKLYRSKAGRGISVRSLFDNDWEAFVWLSERNPDDPWLFAYLQQIYSSWSGYENDSGKTKFIYNQVRKVAGRGMGREISKWHYACAFLAELSGDSEFAMSEIGEAYRLACDVKTRDAIRVMRMFLEAKNKTLYDQEYENHLFRDLVWLNGRIDEYLTEEAMEDFIREGPRKREVSYWNDMMRKILIGEVAPLCMKSGYITRGLQYLNMAENGIVNKVGKTKNLHSDGNGHIYYQDTTLLWEDYRRMPGNSHDYCNYFFDCLDSIQVKHVQRLVWKIGNPHSPVDSFLNRNGYSDLQYFYEIIGTKLLAQMRYKEAVENFSRVSYEFQNSRNVSEYFTRDPFASPQSFWEFLPVRDSLYKLHFAQRMCELERRMKSDHDPNAKAEAMLEFANGLRRSFGGDRDFGDCYGTCWFLTRYYEGLFYGVYDGEFYEDGPQEYLALPKERAIARADRLIEKAFSTFTDEERAARAWSEWHSPRSTVERYPHSTTAEYLLTHCDGLSDWFSRKRHEPAEKS